MKILGLLALFSLSLNSVVASDFVRTNGHGGFEFKGRPYAFVGANFWYGMNLGASGSIGDRARLVRELDRMHGLGINNLRIMGASEGPDSEPWRVVPSLQSSAGVYRKDVLEGLDFLLDEMRKRDMVAVVCLNNFWPWSGGMSQYLAWNDGGSIPYPPPQPGGDWGVYQAYTEKFYSTPKAIQASLDFAGMLITRVNSVSGLPYAQDPAIMAWELANEPRGGSDPQGLSRWIRDTSSWIKSLDAQHLVTTGAEGETPWPSSSGLDLIEDHRAPGIDYVTAHVWAQNWFWYDPKNSQGTWDSAVTKMKAYIRDHVAKAEKLGKPLVIEEFGLARDGGSFDPSTPTTDRDRYYREVFEEVYQEIQAGKPVGGVNFWAWAGEAEPAKPYGGLWKVGTPLIGDPPHENQGWYSVYQRDQSTLALIREYTTKIGAFGRSNLSRSAIGVSHD